MLNAIIDLDKELFTFLNGLNTPYMDDVMFLYTKMWIWIPLFCVIIYALFKRNYRSAIITILAIAVIVLICDQFSSAICKPLFSRLRPSHDNTLLNVHIVNEYKGGLYGFISSHAANYVGIVTLLTLIFRKWFYTIIMVLWVALMCYTRIYLGVHFPGDIMAGSIFGLIIGIIVYYIELCVYKRIYHNNIKFEQNNNKDIILMSSISILNILVVFIIPLFK